MTTERDADLPLPVVLRDGFSTAPGGFETTVIALPTTTTESTKTKQHPPALTLTSPLSPVTPITPQSATTNASTTPSTVGASTVCTATTTSSSKKARQDVVADRFKTKLCTKFLETGSCPYDARCMFAHGEQELRSTSMNLRDGLTTEESIWKYKKSGMLPAQRPGTKAASPTIELPQPQPQPRPSAFLEHIPMTPTVVASPHLMTGNPSVINYTPPVAFGAQPAQQVVMPSFQAYSPAPHAQPAAFVAPAPTLQQQPTMVAAAQYPPPPLQLQAPASPLVPVYSQMPQMPGSPMLFVVGNQSGSGPSSAPQHQ